MIKIEAESLQKVLTDPLSKFLSIIQKLTFIFHSKKYSKNSIKKYLVDEFYRKLFFLPEKNVNDIKIELNKVQNKKIVWN